MMKTKIEGLEISYRNVGELHEKVKELLLEFKQTRKQIESEFKEVKKKEKALQKFLGIKEDIEEAEPKMLL